MTARKSIGYKVNHIIPRNATIICTNLHPRVETLSVVIFRNVRTRQTKHKHCRKKVRRTIHVLIIEGPLSLAVEPHLIEPHASLQHGIMLLRHSHFDALNTAQVEYLLARLGPV